MNKLILYLTAMVLFACLAHAQSIGISPNNINFDTNNNQLKKQITIFNPNDYNIDYTITLDKKDWFSFENNGSIKKNQHKKLVLELDPVKVPKGSHILTATIFFRSKTNAQVSIFPSAKFNIYISNKRDFSSFINLFENNNDSITSNKPDTETGIKIVLAIVLIGALIIYLVFY